MLGGIPKWPTGADCKSAGIRLRRFESFSHHSSCWIAGLKLLLTKVAVEVVLQVFVSSFVVSRE